MIKSDSPDTLFEVGFGSDTGRARRSNEDSFHVWIPWEASSALALDGLFCVADGMGGHSAGDVASRFITDAVRERILEPSGSLAALSPERLSLAIRRILIEINRDLYVHAATDPSLQGMGSTVTLAAAASGWLHIANVGDSRFYILRDGRAEPVTCDDTLVARQVREGRISPDEAAAHPQKEYLTQAMGVAPQVEPRMNRIPLEENCLYLLCSDGLYNMVPDREFGEILAKHEVLQRGCDALIALANERGGKDNITLILFRAQAAGEKGTRRRIARKRTPSFFKHLFSFHKP